MERRTLEDLGFTTVLEELRAMCLSEEGRRELDTIKFITDPTLLAAQQDLVSDLMAIGSYGVDPPIPFDPVSDILDGLSVPGGRLDGQQLYGLGRYLCASSIFTEYCRAPRRLPGSSDPDQTVHPAASLFDPFPEGLRLLSQKIDETLESPGVVKPTHPAIRKLTREFERKRAERQAFSTEFLRRQSDVAQGDQPVFRDGRIVLPVRNDQRASVEGFIHSTSASGATVFIEPYRLVELNNHVVMAQQQIQIETARIIGELSREARRQLTELRRLSAQVGIADSLYARGRYAVRHQCVRAGFGSDGRVRLMHARHPLLREKAVPITLDLDPSVRAVVISGPNAGGKTVTIKTVGLFALMNQFMYFVPANEGTVLPLYATVYTDIGDDQSIEASLSTFSGHMRNIGTILHACDSGSLVILDELGSGTDPVEGSALARAILEHCVGHAALTLVTSHHSVLKQYAYAHSHVLNASMEFDGETHTPTFRVISGLPGESHALDTARRMALPESVLETAARYLGSEMTEVSSIIKGLEERSREMESREASLDAWTERLREQMRQADLRELRLKQEEQLVREQQIGDLSRFISEKRSELENLVAHLREGEITREKTLKVRAFIESLEQQKRESERRSREAAESVRAAVAKDHGEPMAFAVGMDVLAGPSKREGRIVRKEKNGKWLVAVGPVKFPMDERDLQPVARQSGGERPRVSVSYETRSVAPSPTIDVRGMTLDQALQSVSIQIEASLVHAVGGFSIIHGMGDGILARGIHDYLRTVPQVDTYYFARPEDGGYGKTYVEL